MLAWLTGEPGSPPANTSWAFPWQSWQLAADFPAAVIFACVLCAYASFASAWQFAHRIFWGGVSCARLFTSVWQSTQASFMELWMECLSFFASTKSETVLPLMSVVSVGSP